MCFSYGHSRVTEGHLVLSVGARRQMFMNYDSCCMGGILTIVAFHILNSYMVMSEGRHRGFCIIGQFTDMLRSLEGVPLEVKWV